jgi:hypothetical protein
MKLFIVYKNEHWSDERQSIIGICTSKEAALAIFDQFEKQSEAALPGCFVRQEGPLPETIDIDDERMDEEWYREQESDRWEYFRRMLEGTEYRHYVTNKEDRLTLWVEKHESDTYTHLP